MPPNVEYLELAQKRAEEKKTHVSFPQIKYPSLRDGGAKDSTQWLAGKALDDGAEGIWRVHDKLYDLSNFINRHPGGAEWLELTKGTDITEAFESHHINPSVWKMLDKFYVRDAQTPRNSPFTFKEDGFYRTLKTVIAEELNNVPKEAVKQSNRIIDGLLITCLTSAPLSCWAKQYWVVMASYIVASFSLAWVVVAAHNYIHRKTNWRMYLFNLAMWSYRDFRVSHALSHHMYPNTLMDLEISGFEPLVVWNPRKKPTIAKFAIVIQQIVNPILFPWNFVKRNMLKLTRKGYFERHHNWHDYIGLSLPLWMWFVTGETFYNVFTSWLWICCTASYIFFTIGSNAAHHHPKIFKDGDQVRDVTPDWGMHEMEAVMDRKDINNSRFRVLTFFGDHTLHHLFPTLDHGILPYLYPAFLEHCKKFRREFRITSQLDLFIGQVKQTLKTEPNLLND